MTKNKNSKKEADEFEAREPDYKGYGISVWCNKKELVEYLSIQITGHNTIVAFKNDKDKVRTIV